MRLKHTVQVQAWLDTVFKRALFNDSSATAATQTDAWTKQANSVLSVEPGGLEPLSFGDVTLVRGLYLEVDGNARVRLNGAADAIQLAKASDATKAKLFVEAELTQITVENPSGDTTITGVYVIWGDPSA